MADSRRAIFIDANILIYTAIATSPFHHRATRRVKKLLKQGAEIWVSRQVMREYLVNMTRPNSNPVVVPITVLTNDVRRFESRFRIAEDNKQVTAQLLSLAEQIPMTGNLIHDANIVATMQAYGIKELLTHNVKDFVRFQPGITVLPLIP